MMGINEFEGYGDNIRIGSGEWVGEIKLNMPLTEEDWASIADYEFERSDEITFSTPKGKEVVFIKKKVGEWIFDGLGTYCSECKYRPKIGCGKFCSECGADMRSQEKSATWKCYDRTGFLGTDDMPYEYECSNCKMRFPEPTDECPNCRAKMKADGDPEC